MSSTVLTAVLLLLLATVVHCQIAPVTEKSFEGQLIKVDSTMKTISVKGMDEKDVKEITFRYSDDTLIVGGDRTAQGLTGKSGAMVKVTYRVDRGSNEAIRIEMLEKRQ
jgi:hypothetical protein